MTELAPLAMLPNFLVQRKVINPMKAHVGGTVLAVGLAVVHGWAINLGGGMHHAHWEDGAGWCPYADITLAIRRIRCVLSDNKAHWQSEGTFLSGCVQPLCGGRLIQLAVRQAVCCG